MNGAQSFLEISLASGVPALLRNIPDQYNLIRLWTNRFYRLLENLRRTSSLPRLPWNIFKNLYVMHILSIWPSKGMHSRPIMRVGFRRLVTLLDIVLSSLR